MQLQRCIAVTFITGGCAAAACGPPAPAGHDVEIVVNGTVRFATNVGLDSYAWDTLPINLGSVPTFNLETNTVGVNFRDIQEKTAISFPHNPFCTPRPGHICEPFTLRRIPELHLFDRDPREFFFSLMTDPFNNPWASNLSAPTTFGINTPPFEMPADIVIPYGHNSFLGYSYPTHVSIGAFGAQDFLRSENGPATLLSQWSTPSSPQSKALKTTSIKAARLLTLPECSRSVKIQSDVFSQFNGLLGSFDCSLGVQANINAASYLTHEDPNEPNIETALSEPINPWDGIYGGAMVNGFVSLQSKVGLEACSVVFTYDLRYALAAPCAQFDTVCQTGITGYNNYVEKDGVLTIRPIPIVLSTTGGFQCEHDTTFLDFIPQAKTLIQDLFERQVPSTVFKQASAQQAIPPSPIIPSTIAAANEFQCNAVDELTPIGDKCSGAIGQLKFAAATGGGILGLPNSAAVVATFSDPANWRCRFATADEISSDCAGNVYSGGRCEFILPASTLIAEPDELRLGWAPLDQLLAPIVSCTTDSECPSPQKCAVGSGVCEVSPSSAAFVATFAGALGRSNGPAAYQALCSPPVGVSDTHPYYQRYFATLGAHVCGPQPPPPGPPCTGGRTQCGSVCVDENADFNNCGSCSTICPFGNGLTYGGFSCRGGACVPSLTCACSQDINCIDIMGNGARCTGGLCIPAH